MKQEGLNYFNDIYLTVFGLVLFFILFTGIVIWVYRRSAKKHFEKMSKLPLDEESDNG